MRDGIRRPNQTNEFTIDEWVNFYANQFVPIKVTNAQLEVLFEYLLVFKTNVVNFNGVEYRTVNFETNNFDTYFFIDMVILKAL